MVRVVGLVMVFGVAVECGAPSRLPPPPEPHVPIAREHSADFELGKGRDAFYPLPDGDVLSAQPGPQGCCHLFLALHALNVDPGAAKVRIGYYDVSDGGELQDNVYRFELGRFIAADGGGFTLTGMLAFLPTIKEETDLEVRAELTDAKEQVLTDYHTVHVLPFKP